MLKNFFFLILFLSESGFCMELNSNDLKPNGKIPEDFVYQGMGCTGKNLSPELHWTGAPKGTKSFAVTVYDPDAPTGSGFWHWVVINIPPSVTSLKQGWKSTETPGVIEIPSDFGAASYGGPCPPPGKPHHYKFSVHALKTDKLDLPAGASNAFARFMIEGATLSKGTFTALYGR